MTPFTITVVSFVWPKNASSIVQEHAQLTDLTSEYWREWKWQLAEKDPLIAEDVIAWRVETLRHLLTHHGKKCG